jgi:hypothetical protein
MVSLALNSTINSQRVIQIIEYQAKGVMKDQTVNSILIVSKHLPCCASPQISFDNLKRIQD